MGHAQGGHIEFASMMDMLLTKLWFMRLRLVTNIAYDVNNNNFALDYLLFQTRRAPYEEKLPLVT